METNFFDYKPVPTPDEVAERFINLISENLCISDEDKKNLRIMLDDFTTLQRNGFSEENSLKKNEIVEFLESRKIPE